jgi:hypothetical protein
MRPAQAILWASAFILAALVIVTAGRLPESTAHANMAVSGQAGYTMVTAASGIGTPERPIELLYVIDNQTQTLFVYTIETANQRRILMRGGGSLAGLFRTARGSG